MDVAMRLAAWCARAMAAARRPRRKRLGESLSALTVRPADADEAEALGGGGVVKDTGTPVLIPWALTAVSVMV